MSKMFNIVEVQIASNLLGYVVWCECVLRMKKTKMKRTEADLYVILSTEENELLMSLRTRKINKLVDYGPQIHPLIKPHFAVMLLYPSISLAILHSFCPALFFALYLSTGFLNENFNDRPTFHCSTYGIAKQCQILP